MANLTGLGQGIMAGLEQGRRRRIDDEERERRHNREDTAAERSTAYYNEWLAQSENRSELADENVRGVKNQNDFSEENQEEKRRLNNRKRDVIEPDQDEARALGLESARYGHERTKERDSQLDEDRDYHNKNVRPIQREAMEVGLEQSKDSLGRSRTQDVRAQKEDMRGDERYDFDMSLRGREQDLVAGKDFVRLLPRGPESAVQAYNRIASKDAQIIPESVQFDRRTGRLSFEEEDGDVYDGSIQEFADTITTAEERIAAAKAKKGAGDSGGRKLSAYNPTTVADHAKKTFQNVNGGTFEGGFFMPDPENKERYQISIGMFGSLQEALGDEFLNGKVSGGRAEQVVVEAANKIRNETELRKEFGSDQEKIKEARIQDIENAKTIIDQFIQENGGNAPDAVRQPTQNVELPQAGKDLVDQALANGKRTVTFATGQVWSKQDGRYIRVK